VPDDPAQPLLREVGRTGRAHGVRGDLYLILLTDREERTRSGARLKVGETWHSVERARRAGDRWFVHFYGVDDRTAAEALANMPVFAEPIPTPPGELYVHDLIGAEVVDLAGDLMGRCVAVLANPAHDLLELDNGGLVPVVFIVRADPGRVVVDAPEGLLDLIH
jgi:16S rRNA processing protein RimM